MRFDPIEEENEELSGAKPDRKPLSSGFGVYLIWEAVRHVAPSGNESLKLSVLVKDEHGGSGFVTDYLSPKATWKIKQFLASCGMESEYKNGELTPELCHRKEGTCRIESREGTKWFNIVEYIKPAKKAGEKVALAPVGEPFFGEEDMEDDLPF
jgi:hypothetical protein